MFDNIKLKHGFIGFHYILKTSVPVQIGKMNIDIKAYPKINSHISHK